MEWIVQSLIIVLWLVIIPTAAGGIVINAEKRKVSFLFFWVMGQVLLWAVFQLLCVPFILMQEKISFPFWGQETFPLVVLLYQIISFGLAGLGLGKVFLRYLARRRNKKNNFRVVPRKTIKNNQKKLCYFFWILFWVLFFFQLIQAVRLTYGDGDDAFYVAVSTITEESNTMYQKLPYTGGTTGLDSRHGLAPFPIWIAFLARVSGIRTVSIAHVVLPLSLISMTYAVFYFIGKVICEKKSREKLPLFLVFTELLVLFGDYSFYTTENFMIARSRQGKAAFGSIILPILFFLLLVLLERVQENRKIEWIWWLLLSSAIISACLCTTLGALLVCMLVGVTGLCAAVSYRKPHILLPMALCCMPAVGYAILYFLL